MTKKLILALFLVGGTLPSAVSQQSFVTQPKTFDWVPTSSESIRLDPADYYVGQIFQPGTQGGSVRVAIDAGQPVTVAMTPQEPTKVFRWVPDHDEIVRLDPGNYYAGPTLESNQDIQVNIEAAQPVTVGMAWVPQPTVITAIQSCHQEHVVTTSYSCHIPVGPPLTLVITDERKSDRNKAPGAQTERGEIVSAHPLRTFVSPVDIRLRYSKWVCVDFCNPGDSPFGRPEAMEHLSYICIQEHVVRANYTCNLPPQPMVLVVRDERRDPRRAFAERGEVLSGRENRADGDDAGSPKAENSRSDHDPDRRSVDRAVSAGVDTVLSAHSFRRFLYPNDVGIQYYRWDCVENCYQPEFRWVRQIREKYELTNILKVYGGISADYDNEPISIKIKSPVPMAVAILPAKVAGQLYGKPEMFESAVENSSCQQRAVQSSTFQCQLKVSDGPQSLVIRPEDGAEIPRHKKAEVEIQAAQCVENCSKLVSRAE